MTTVETDTPLTDALRRSGHRVTSQRVILHRALRELDRHTSAEDVRRAATDRLPHLSLPTVYAALELFERLGLVRRIDAGTGTVLYDARREEHHHFACRGCGRVIDVDASPDLAVAADAARSAGLTVEGAQVLLTGLCDRCAEG